MALVICIVEDTDDILFRISFKFAILYILIPVFTRNILRYTRQRIGHLIGQFTGL